MRTARITNMTSPLRVHFTHFVQRTYDAYLPLFSNSFDSEVTFCEQKRVFHCSP